MSRNLRLESPTGLYHVMQRGTGKQIIFEDENDYDRYIRKLIECRDKFHFKIIGYCLMNNHVHLLIRTDSISILSSFMRDIGSSYAKYYNVKYDHSGHVFQDRYLSEIIRDERYLLECLRYIHNNPVKAGISNRENYCWSSYNDYIYGKGIADTEEILEIFGGSENFKVFSKERDLAVPLECEMPDDKLALGLTIINDELGHKYNNGFIVKKLIKEVRDKVLRRLRREGFSYKQIELLTGVSKRIIQRA